MSGVANLSGFFFFKALIPMVNQLNDIVMDEAGVIHHPKGGCKGAWAKFSKPFWLWWRWKYAPTVYQNIIANIFLASH